MYAWHSDNCRQPGPHEVLLKTPLKGAPCDGIAGMPGWQVSWVAASLVVRAWSYESCGNVSAGRLGTVAMAVWICG